MPHAESLFRTTDGSDDPNTEDDGSTDIYCDGSICDSVLLDPLRPQRSGEYIGRVMVLAPRWDRGFIVQVRDGILTGRGSPNSAHVEWMAIQTAFTCCARWGIKRFTIYSDCQGAVTREQDDRVRWACREQMHLPNDYFDRVWRRLQYLRSTEGKVGRRCPIAAHQQEILDLLQSERCEFRLSESPLWKRINDRIHLHPEALG